MSYIDDWIRKARRRLEHDLIKIEERKDLTIRQKVDHIRHATCAVCSAVAVQPLPFADLFLLTPLQGLMGVKIAHIHGIRISENKAQEVIKELLGLVGLGFAAQQFAIGAYKTVLPFLGALTTIPMVYGLTYAMGAVMNHYFEARAQGRAVDPEEIRELWRRARREGRAQAGGRS